MPEMREQVHLHLRKFLVGRMAVPPAQNETVTPFTPFPIFTDRTRVLKFQKCPRSRWWANEFAGRGISPRAMAIPLATGVYVHEGLASLLAGEDVEEAVGKAIFAYKLEIDRRGLVIPAGDAGAMFDVAHEQVALTEALIRAYAAFALPRLLEDFEVVEVEKEDIAPLNLDDDADDADDANGEKQIHWQARTDGLLREKQSGDLYVMSFKTAAQWDKRTDSGAKHDMQGLSEPYAIEFRLGKAQTETQAATNVPYAKIWGVKMEYLIKGVRREYPKGSGSYRTYSPLIYGYRLRGVTPDQDRYSCEYKAAKGWELFKVWEAKDIGGVKGWIEMLRAGEVEPIEKDCLAEQFVLQPPYMRHEDETENWRQQTVMQERRVAEHSRYLNQIMHDELSRGDNFDFQNGGALEVMSRYFFPQHTSSCDYPSACEYTRICWDKQSPLALLESGEFTWRTPHHEPELEHLRSIGLMGLPIPERMTQGVATSEPLVDVDEAMAMGGF